MAKLDQYAYDLPDPTYGSDWQNSDHEKGMQALLNHSRDLPEGQIVGAVLRWQRADGYAFYLVTKERPLTLQWIPYGDCWQVEDALIRGLTKDDVIDMVRRERKLRELFSGKK